MTSPTRFRRSSAITVAAVIAMIAGLSLATWAPPYVLVVLVVPLAVAVWAWRSGTDADRDGLTVRALLGQRRIPWSDVSGLVTDDRRRVSAQLTSGRAVPLPAVTGDNVPAIIGAAGQELVHDPR